MLDTHLQTRLSTAAVRAVPVRARRERRRARWNAAGPWVLGAAGILSALLVWQLFSALGPSTPTISPPRTS